MNFLRLYRDPEAGKEGGADNQADIDALEKALIDEGGSGEPAKKEVDLDKGDGGTGGGKKEDAGKAGAADDPEHEIDFKDEKGTITKQKVKLSELKSGYLRQDDYTKKTQRVSEVEKNQKDLITTIEAIRQNPKLAKLFVGIVEGAISKEGYNESFIDKQLKNLEGVQAEAGDTKKDLSEKQEDIEEILKDVDPDSPLAKALKQTWLDNQALKKSLKGFEDGLGKVTKSVEERTTKEQEAQYKSLVDSAAKIMSDTLDTMTDPDKGTLKFDSPEEQKEWRYKVVAFLKDNPQDYKDDKEFVVKLDEVGKAVHTYMVKYRESILAKHLTGGLKKPVEKKIETQSADAMTLEQELEKELNAISGGAQT